jgi:hypothetical protein
MKLKFLHIKENIVLVPQSITNQQTIIIIYWKVIQFILSHISDSDSSTVIILLN